MASPFASMAERAAVTDAGEAFRCLGPGLADCQRNRLRFSMPPQHGGEEQTRIGADGGGEKSVDVGENRGLFRHG